MIFAVFGGDKRQARLAAQLKSDGHTVRAFAMEGAELPAEVIHFSEITRGAVSDADCVILPLPASVKRGYLNAPMAAEDHCIGEVFGAMLPGQIACAGITNDYMRSLAELQCVQLFDYYTREELLAINAVATAEGAIGILLQETDAALWQSRILILGWGRLGHALAPRLQAFGARVSVSARNPGDIAWISAGGFEPLDTRRLESRLGGFDILINTIPSLVLTADRLRELRPSALVIDLAS
ncbi:MAG TPA: dipicolinate synthase, partial [Clostridiales bacterium]|nr:dipicolinate synthase [Clostridiales bacterium]